MFIYWNKWKFLLNFYGKIFAMCLTRVMSLEAAAALMWRLGCLTVLVQSKALAKVPTDLKYTHKSQYLYHTLISCGVKNKYNTQNGYLFSSSKYIIPGYD